ncbi:hypothetical protein PDESU_01266 [Pontiella desulfatans]|uniref:GIY-YIG domain-containing protein n=1 Tax=Pontiella desulfatans TaxID=2750659 RepID=A0A6C2TYI9_PONDE|nr:hypothetical protein [Pontiella desulfatans]VGO12712.1 hypothetical protein PDESU_01266 [Pontiella desulfatans]
MGIQIGSYNFEGPYTSTSNLRNSSGVYSILGRNSEAETWKVVDIGESQEVKERIENHDRKPCWQRRGYRTITVAAHYTSAAQRMRIEKELRAKFDPPCGKR